MSISISMSMKEKDKKGKSRRGTGKHMVDRISSREIELNRREGEDCGRKEMFE